MSDECKVCGGDTAYPGAVYCGAECCAIHETKDVVRAAAKRVQVARRKENDGYDRDGWEMLQRLRNSVG